MFLTTKCYNSTYIGNATIFGGIINSSYIIAFYNKVFLQLSVLKNIFRMLYIDLLWYGSLLLLLLLLSLLMILVIDWITVDNDVQNNESFLLSLYIPLGSNLFLTLGLKSFFSVINFYLISILVCIWDIFGSLRNSYFTLYVDWDL